MKRKVWWVLLLTFLIGFVVYFVVLSELTGLSVFWHNETVRAWTIVTTEQYYICGERVRLSEGPTPSALIGMDVKALQKRFPAKDGWTMELYLPDMIRLSRMLPDFCPRHRLYRHLGIKDGYVVVFEGPLGYNDRLVHREHLPEAALAPGLRNRLIKSMNLTQQPEVIQAELRRELEFPNETQLEAVLENLDEWQE